VACSNIRDFYATATDVGAVATDVGPAILEVHEKVADATAPPAGGAIFRKVFEAFEARFNDSRMQAMLREFLSDIEFPEGARVLEIGCGDGVVTRRLARWPKVAHTTGIDRSKIFIARAQKLAHEIQNVSFEEGDGRRTRFDEGTFDVVVLHTVLLHALEPEKLIAEAFRVMRSGGWLAVFDADDATVATGKCDPLQACIDVLPVQNPGLVHRLPSMLENRGFKVLPMRSHGYVEAPEGGLMLGWIDRGADALVKLGRIGNELSEALRVEARRRSASKSWFGHISFFSELGRKP
jgi:arsenite methyltransferase